MIYNIQLSKTDSGGCMGGDPIPFTTSVCHQLPAASWKGVN